jgi:aspartate aminotransferase
MFEVLRPQPPDKIIELMELFRSDPRSDKVDLGVGVYKDAEGRTPIMRAVKRAEERLLREQTTKSYLGLLGDLDFVSEMRALILGDAADAARVAGAQTPGGTGAVHQLLQAVRLARPESRVWISDPTWPNHPAIIGHVGLEGRTYRYFDSATRGVDFPGMEADLQGAAAGDIVLLHGCCHNPTGANLSLDEWRRVTAIVGDRGAVPMVDLAYQGFGDGLAEDAAGLRHMTGTLPETLIAASCSKNFGLYRDRAGAAFIVCADADATGRARGTLAGLNRMVYSFPPDHGAKVVQMILSDTDLRAEWEAELAEMREAMLTLRRGLADALRRETNGSRFDFVAEHRGMFSRIGLEPSQVIRLREEHGIYMVGDSRINVAGLPRQGMERVARAIAAVAG